MPYTPGPELLQEIRIAFIRQGTTFNAWCGAHTDKVNRQNARLAILGGWRGPKAQKLVKQIIKAAGLNPHQEAA